MKKTFAQIIALMMLLTMIPTVQTYAAESDTKEEKCNAQYFFETFNIQDDSMSDDAVVTRGQYAHILKAILTRSDMSVQSGTVELSDTKEDNAYYNDIQFVLKAGFMTMSIGDASPYAFRADDAVTQNEVLYEMLSLLNATNLIRNYGGYPSGVYQAAKVSGIDPADGKMTLLNIKKMMYKTLNADVTKVRKFSDGTFEYYVDDGDPYIYEHWNLYKVEGILTANSMINITGASAEGDNAILIGDTKYMSYLGYENMAYIGSYITAFAEDSDNISDTVQCMFPNDRYEKPITLTGEYIDSVSELSRIVSYDSNNKKTDYTVALTANVFYNFDYIGPVRAIDYNDATVKEALDAINAGKSCEIMLAENTMDTKYDFVWIRIYDNYVVNTFSYENFKVNDKYGRILDMKEAYQYNEILFFNADGKLASINDIGENAVLSMISEKEENKVKKAVGYLSKTQVAGKITGINDDECTISENTYKISTIYQSLCNEGDSRVIILKAGVSTTFYLNAFGEIVGASKNDYYYEGESYAFILKAYYMTNDDNVKVKIIDEEGNITVVPLKSSTTINGAAYRNKKAYDAMAALSLKKGMTADDCTYAYVYKMAKITVSSKEIIKMEIDVGVATNAAGKKTASDGSSLVGRLYPDKSLTKTDGISNIVFKSNTFGKAVGVSSSTIIFDVPSESTYTGAITGDDDAFYRTSVNNLQDDCALGLSGIKSINNLDSDDKMSFYKLDNTLFAEAAVRYYTYKSDVGGVAAAPELLSDCVIVSKVMDAVNDDNEDIKIIKGFQSGNAVTIETNPIRDLKSPWTQFSSMLNCAIENPSSGTSVSGANIFPIQPGDVLQIAKNTKGQLNNMIINVRAGNKNNAMWLSDSISAFAAGHGNQYLGINYGTITAYENGKIVLSELDGKNRVYSVGSPTITIYNRTSKNVSKGSANDLELGKDIYVRQYYSQVKEIVVYEDE